ncbi:hypothetical protein SMD22_00920 (plasmid) [Brevibacillus halotolerans]|nr:hypothetical protein SMD22_00920 [Brevibacillus halotolerans]
MSAYYYVVEKGSLLHCDLEIALRIKGNFLTEMGNEVSDAIQIENAVQKIVYRPSEHNPDLSIREEYKCEVPIENLKKHPFQIEGRNYYKFKKNSPYQKAFTQFIKDHKLEHIVSRQDFTYVVPPMIAKERSDIKVVGVVEAVQFNPNA